MKTTFILKAALFFILLSSLCALAADQPSDQVPTDLFPQLDESQVICAAGSPWYEFGQIHLEIFERSQEYKGNWTLEIAKNQDLRLIIDETIGSEKKQGEILVISGRSMVTKGLVLPPGYEIDALDGPVLMCQLAISLLHVAFPDGPQSIKADSSINLSENQKAIKIATPSASGLFGAPWSVDGFVKRDGEKLNFQMNYLFKLNANAPNPVEMKLVGSWDGAEKIPKIPDSLSLKDWKINNIGPYKQEVEGGTILDYGARPQNITFITVGDLRKSLEKDEKE